MFSTGTRTLTLIAEMPSAERDVGYVVCNHILIGFDLSWLCLYLLRKYSIKLKKGYVFIHILYTI